MERRPQRRAKTPPDDASPYGSRSWRQRTRSPIQRPGLSYSPERPLSEEPHPRTPHYGGPYGAVYDSPHRPPHRRPSSPDPPLRRGYSSGIHYDQRYASGVGPYSNHYRPSHRGRSPPRHDEPFTSVDPWGWQGRRGAPQSPPRMFPSSPTVVEAYPMIPPPVERPAYLQYPAPRPAPSGYPVQPPRIVKPKPMPSDYPAPLPHIPRPQPAPSPEFEPVRRPLTPEAVPRPYPARYPSPKRPPRVPTPSPERVFDPSSYGPGRSASPIRFPQESIGYGHYGSSYPRPSSRPEPYSPVDPWEWRPHRPAATPPNPKLTYPPLEYNWSSPYVQGHPPTIIVEPSSKISVPSGTPYVTPPFRPSTTIHVNPGQQQTSFREQLSLRFLYFALLFALNQIYLHFLLRIPRLYYTRVARVIDDAELSKDEVQEMALAAKPNEYLLSWRRPMSPAVSKFKDSWFDLVHSLMDEWRNQNIISVLLLSAVLTMLQIDGFEGDPISRTATLLSLICTLMSLLYGCIYMARFGSMNKLYKAMSWAEVAGARQKNTFWNVWVFLALPAVWLSWSLVCFSVAVLSYIWRTGSTSDPVDPIRLPSRDELGPRLALSIVFGLGLVYLVLILDTLRQYGSSMDDAWRNKIKAMREMKERKYSPKEDPVDYPSWSYTQPRPTYFSDPPKPVPSYEPHPSQMPTWPDRPEPIEMTSMPPAPYRTAINADPGVRPRAFDQPWIPPRPSSQFPFKFDMVELRLDGTNTQHPWPSMLDEFQFGREAWDEFIRHASQVWQGNFPMGNLPEANRRFCSTQILLDLVDTWNDLFFHQRQLIASTIWPSSRPSGYGHEALSSQTSSQDSAVIVLKPLSGQPVHAHSESYTAAYTGPSAARTHQSPTLEYASAPGSPYRTDSPKPVPPGPSAITSHSYDVPGPYLQSLLMKESFPEAFITPVAPDEIVDERVASHLEKVGFGSEEAIWEPDIEKHYRVPWGHYARDLHQALTGTLPIPFMSADQCLQMRSLIVSDLNETWSKYYFRKRGLEVISYPDARTSLEQDTTTRDADHSIRLQSSRYQDLDDLRHTLEVHLQQEMLPKENLAAEETAHRNSRKQSVRFKENVIMGAIRETDQVNVDDLE